MKRIYTAILLIFLFALGVHASDSEARITHFDERDGFTESYVTGVIQDYYGFIWVSSWNGLSCYDGYRFKTFKAHPGDNCPLQTNRINGIVELRNHDILCVSEKRYYIFHRNSLTFERLNSDRYKRMFQNFHPSPSVEKQVRNLPEYRDIEVKFLCQDRQGGVWIQSNRGFERVRFVSKPIETEKIGTEGEESVRGLFRDSRGRVWIADKNGVVRVIANMTDAPIAVQQSLYLSPTGQLSPVPVRFGSNVYSFHEDKQGNLWLGTKPNGLFRLSPIGNGFSVTHYLNNPADPWSISDNNIYDITEDSRGRIYIATFHGGLNILLMGSDGKTRFISPRNMLKAFPGTSMQCRCLQLMPDGTLLIGSTDGLVTCSTKWNNASDIRFFLNRRNPGLSSSLSSNYIDGMLTTRSGVVLVATSGGGVDRITSKSLLTDNIRFTHFSSREGLLSDMTLALQEDSSGHVWVVSEASLSRLDLNKHESVNYMRGFFTGRFAFTEVPPLCLPDGRIIIGTTQGTLSFNTMDVAKSSYVPRIVFDCPDKLDIEAGKKDFSVAFAALDYNKNEDIVYAYRMEGFDNEWHYTTTNELHYVGLRPGNYKLHVRSTNGDGVWVDNEKVITIHKRAWFTETPYFWMLLGLIVAALLYTAYKVLTYIRRLQNEIKDIQLTSNEKIALLGERVRELLSISESVEKADTSAQEDDLSDDDRNFAEKLKGFITDNIGNSDLVVQNLADTMCVSRTVLFAHVKRVFGCSPNNLILNMRINRAKELLAKGNPLIADVAYRCGFSDPKYFSRCFKKITGKKPKEWKA